VEIMVKYDYKLTQGVVSAMCSRMLLLLDQHHSDMSKHVNIEAEEVLTFPRTVVVMLRARSDRGRALLDHFEENVGRPEIQQVLSSYVEPLPDTGPDRPSGGVFN